MGNVINATISYNNNENCIYAYFNQTLQELQLSFNVTDLSHVLSIPPFLSDLLGISNAYHGIDIKVDQETNSTDYIIQPGGGNCFIEKVSFKGVINLNNILGRDITIIFTPNKTNAILGDLINVILGLLGVFTSMDDVLKKYNLDNLDSEILLSLVLTLIGTFSNEIILNNGDSWQNILNDINIGDVWGIGNNTAYLLKKFGINSALDFAVKDEVFIDKYLSKPYKETWLELRGNSVFGINPSAKSTYKTISKAKSFYPPSGDDTYLFSELTKNLENACAKARRFNLAAAKISIFLKTKDFKASGVQIKLTTPSAFPPMLMNALEEGFRYIYEKGCLYRQTEVVLHLTENVQYSLFDDMVKIDKIKRIYDSIDYINKKFGRNSVHLASSMPSLQSRHSSRFSIPLMDIKI